MIQQELFVERLGDFIVTKLLLPAREPVVRRRDDYRASEQVEAHTTREVMEFAAVLDGGC